MKLFLGWAGEKMGVRFATPIFDGATTAEIEAKSMKQVAFLRSYLPV
jgi:DNA-directed RNA polymerase beta subunit